MREHGLFVSPKARYHAPCACPAGRRAGHNEDERHTIDDEGTIMASDSDYERQAQAMLERIEQAIETHAPEIEFETEDEILTLEFPDDSRIIVNKQRPLKQIWLAARAGGFHYDYDTATGRWVRAGGHELLADLETFASRQLQKPVRLR